MAEHRKGAVVLGAGLCRDPLRHLLLHHDGDRLEAPGFQQGRQDGRGNIVRQVGTGHGAQTGQLFGHQFRDIQLQNVLPEDLQILKFPHRLLQNRPQAAVHLHGTDLPCPQTKLLGQRADARANLQNAHIPGHPGCLRDLLRHPGSDKEILSLGFGKVETVLRKQRLHHLNIANIKHKTPPFFP